MNISTQIIEIIDALCEKLGIVIDWTADNIWPYVQSLCKKFIVFEISTSIFWIAFVLFICAVLWIVTAILCAKARKLEWDEYADVSTVAVIGLVVSIIWSVITIIVVGVQVYDIIEASHFPEKAIYDYIVRKIQMHS